MPLPDPQHGSPPGAQGIQPTVVYQMPHFINASFKRPPIKYSDSNKNPVLWLSALQISLGVFCLVCQIVTLALHDTLNADVNRILQKFSLDHIYSDYNEPTDSSGTGIWVGIVFIISGAVGVKGSTENRQGLINTHLVLNIFNLGFAITLIGTAADSVASLSNCITRGWLIFGDYNYLYNYYDYSRPTSTLYGEEVYPGKRFNCNAGRFTTWRAMAGVMVMASVLLFFLTLTLVVYNSIAACRCCRCCYPDMGQSQAPSVVYSHTVASSVPFTPYPRQGFHAYPAPPVYGAPSAVHPVTSDPYQIPATYGQTTTASAPPPYASTG